jgi:hypothetical protein
MIGTLSTKQSNRSQIDSLCANARVNWFMSIKPADMGMTLSNNSNSQEINYITETKFRSNNVWSDTLSGEIGCLILTVAA